jgi:hypothetical protein
MSNAMWGYLLELRDLRSGDARKQDPCMIDNVMLDSRDSSPGFVTVGAKAKYGYVRDPLTPDDYYVVMSERSNSPVISKDIRATAFYPERVFVWGEDDDGDSLTREHLLQQLKILGLSGDAGFWKPCHMWSGYNRGLPTFNRCLRADANIGVNWSAVTSRLSGKLPAGYEAYKEGGYYQLEYDSV